MNQNAEASPRRLVVTGGAGFLGSHYVRALLSGGLGRVEQVTVIDALTYAGERANLADVAGDARLRTVVGDITDAGLLADVLPGHDAVINIAAESHVDRSISGDVAFSRSNVLGTHVVLESARRSGVSIVVQVSTDEVYGSIDAGSWDENAPLRPSSAYSATKAAGDLLALSYHHTHGMDVRITRGSNTYGSHQHAEKLIPRFITTLLAGERVPLYGDGSQIREWLHVDDHCHGIQLVLERGRAGRVYHVGGGVALTNLDLTEKLRVLCGRGHDAVEYVADRPGHDRRYALDWSRIRAELGYRPLREIDSGLAETVAWYARCQGLDGMTTSNNR